MQWDWCEKAIKKQKQKSTTKEENKPVKWDEVALQKSSLLDASSEQSRDWLNALGIYLRHCWVYSYVYHQRTITRVQYCPMPWYQSQTIGVLWKVVNYTRSKITWRMACFGVLGLNAVAYQKWQISGMIQTSHWGEKGIGKMSNQWQSQLEPN